MWLAAVVAALVFTAVGARAVRATGDTPHRWLCDACGWDTDYEDEGGAMTRDLCSAHTRWTLRTVHGSLHVDDATACQAVQATEHTNQVRDQPQIVAAARRDEETT